jgi:3-phenylpropionate/trans-cinnamate dioxygenase ferredoxin reductase component
VDARASGTLPDTYDRAVPGFGRAAGLNVDNGIIVGERLESSAPDVFAAGDAARAWSPFYQEHIRVEHWANALNQGPAAARSMLGDRMWDQVLLRGDLAGDEFMAFWLLAGRAAGMDVNVWDVNEQVQALIRSRREIDVRALADSGTSLDSLIP